MKFAIAINGVALAALLSTGSLVPSISFAGANDGAKLQCPSGYATSFSNENKVVKCSKTNPGELRKSVCPVILTPLPVSMQYHQRVGADNCTRNDNGATVATVPELVLDPQNWERQVDGAAGALDRFHKKGTGGTDFAYPDKVNL